MCSHLSLVIPLFHNLLSVEEHSAIPHMNVAHPVCVKNDGDGFGEIMQQQLQKDDLGPGQEETIKKKFKLTLP